MGDCQTMGGMMGGLGSVMGSGWMAVAMLVNVLVGLGFLALLVVGAVAAIQWVTRSADSRRRLTSADRAFEAARERYARGEISREEFQRLREDLT